MFEKIKHCAARVGAFLSAAGVLFMAALVWLLSAWQAVLICAGVLVAVGWIWALAGLGSAIVAALAFALVGALAWMANYFSL